MSGGSTRVITNNVGHIERHTAAWMGRKLVGSVGLKRSFRRLKNQMESAIGNEMQNACRVLNVERCVQQLAKGPNTP